MHAGPHVPGTSYLESLQSYTMHQTDPDWVPTLKIKRARKSDVVQGDIYERAFSTRLSPALKLSSLAQNAFVSRTESVRLQHIRHVRLLFASWYRNPQKGTETGEKSLCTASFS